ncbi:hypothetical protein LguiA_030529 [Lonicera macranthoides]
MDYTQNARIARLRRRLIRESNSSRHCSDRQFHVNRISQREIRRHDAVQNISPSTDSLCQTTFFNNQKVGNFSTRRDIISHSIVTLDGKVVTTTLEPMANASNVANSNYCGYTITNIRAAIESSTLQHFSSVRNQVPELQETICNTIVDGRNEATKSNYLPKRRNNITESSRPPKRNRANQITETLCEQQSQPIIVIVTSTSVKEFKGEIYLTTTTLSKVYLNLDIPEVEELKRRYKIF